MLRIAEEILKDFQEKCNLKCQSPGDEFSIEDLEEYEILPTDSDNEDNEDDESEDDLWWDSEGPRSPRSLSHSDIPSRSSLTNVYRLSNFKSGIV